MPLISINCYLEVARSGDFAVPLFDAIDSTSVDGMLAAAEEKYAPLIIGLYSGTLAQANAPALIAYIRARAQASTMPVSLMLDHGSSLEQCRQAVDFGFSDVMFDGSRLSLEENIAQTRAVVDMAHPLGVGVEAELGHVGSGGEYQQYGAQRKGFTDPEAVERFVAETGVDFLAIAIGNAHGVYQGEPCLDFDLLAQIRTRVRQPLVLHGGSGSSEAQFHSAITGGIAKINVVTDLYKSAGQQIRAMIVESPERTSYFDLQRAGVEAFTQQCGYYLELFGAAGKG